MWTKPIAYNTSEYCRGTYKLLTERSNQSYSGLKVRIHLPFGAALPDRWCQELLLALVLAAVIALTISAADPSSIMPRYDYLLISLLTALLASASAFRPLLVAPRSTPSRIFYRDERSSIDYPLLLTTSNPTATSSSHLSPQFEQPRHVLPPSHLADDLELAVGRLAMVAAVILLGCEGWTGLSIIEQLQSLLSI